MSERFACRVLGQHRSTQHKIARTRDDEAALTVGVTVNLHDAREAGKKPARCVSGCSDFRFLRIDIDGDRRICAAESPVVARISPELAGLGAPPSGVEHRRLRLVGEDFRRRPYVFQKRSCTGRRCQAARPTQSASVERSSATPCRA